MEVLPVLAGLLVMVVPGLADLTMMGMPVIFQVMLEVLEMSVEEMGLLLQTQLHQRGLVGVEPGYVMLEFREARGQPEVWVEPPEEGRALQWQAIPELYLYAQVAVAVGGVIFKGAVVAVAVVAVLLLLAAQAIRAVQQTPQHLIASQ
jgi:hypothetical protein